MSGEVAQRLQPLNARLLRMGEACIVVEFGNTIDPELNERVHWLARYLEELRIGPESSIGPACNHILELVPTYRSLAVYFDPIRGNRKALEEEIENLLQELEKRETGIKSYQARGLRDDQNFHKDQGQGLAAPRTSLPTHSPEPKSRTVIIPVCYGGEFGPDLPFVAKHSGLTEEEVVRIHTSKAYRVYMLGFLPGFPYLGGMDERLSTPRLETPRTRIPAGSVGIAGSQTGFYPLESPGGWRIIGRTPIKAFNPFSDPPCLLAPGDFVQFTSIGEAEYRRLLEEEDRMAGVWAIPPIQGREATSTASATSGITASTPQTRIDLRRSTSPGLQLRVLDPGLLTTVQDLGRWGFQAFGVSPAGVMDEYAAELTNLLVGNQKEAALLEITLKGPTLKFEKGGWVAIGGADCGATLDGKPIPNWSAFYGEAGSTLAMGFVREGCRAYLACEGGFDVPLLMGSGSTYLRAKMGGLDGRPLQEGDVLAGRPGKKLDAPGKELGAPGYEAATGKNSNASRPQEPTIRTLPPSFIPRYGSPILLRVLLGPQDDLFEPEGLETFFNSTYIISHEADRMGYRLEGPKIKHRGKADIVSDALARGSIQVPGHGMPIVMMADRQTTGGYTKLGTVILADQHLLAQGKPGDEVRFFPCTEEEAIMALQEQKARISLLSRYLGKIT